MSSHRYSSVSPLDKMPASAPVIPVDISTPWGISLAKVNALVDSGACQSCIPLRIAIHLAPIREDEIITIVGKAKVGVYFVSLRIEGTDYPYATLGVDYPYPIIGRDILNKLVVKLDGPGQILTIS